MENVTLAKPVQVSGSIKAARWSLLIYGIICGNSNWHKYRSRQQKIREERHKIWPVIKAEQEAETLKRRTEQLRTLSKELGIDLPPDWTAKDI